MRGLRLDEVSGARVTAGFNSPGVADQIGQKSPHIARGTELPLSVLRTIPQATLDAMTTNQRHLALIPKGKGAGIHGAAPLAAHGATTLTTGLTKDLERVVVDAGNGKFDVIEGVKINAKPLTEKAAQKLADAVPKP